MLNPKLRYRIDSWYDLPKCQSNISQDYSISVSRLIKKELRGCRITVKHTRFGVVFSTIVDGSGELINIEDTGRPHEFTTRSILEELEKFGFSVEYHPELHLPIPMINYLITLRSLNYSKLRHISVDVDGNGISRDFVVGFMPAELSKWLLNTYDPSNREFTKALVEGYACNISMSPEGQKLDWSWLTYIANIDDLLFDSE